MRLPSANGPRLRAASFAALALLGACDIPTSAPIVDSRWIVPSKSTTIAVSNLLPSGVSIVADSSAFDVSAPGASVSRSLGQDCAACVAANGLVIPKPAFTASASASTSFASDIASATLSSGTLQVSVVNGFNFDPLRPSATARGFVRIVVSNGGQVIGSDSVSGTAVALPAGGTLLRIILLSGTITGSSPVTVSLTMDSPLGDPVQINSSRAISATATPVGLRVASAAVVVRNRQMSSTTTIDLTGVDSAITDRVRSGALLLGVTNPFAVSGALAVTLTPVGGAPVTKSLALTVGTSAPRIEFTNAELRALLGHYVTLGFSGPVNGTTASVTITPRSAVSVTSHLDLNLRIGG